MLNIIIQKYIAKNNLQYGKKWIINHKKNKIETITKKQNNVDQKTQTRKKKPR